MLVLASNSPRRKELLAFGGWDFCVRTAQVNELVCNGESPIEYVVRLAIDKAQAVADLFTDPHPDTLIVAADTAVVDRSPAKKTSLAQINILGKPSDRLDAEGMLRRLRGRTHQVYTGVAVLRLGNGELQREVCITDVPMRLYSDDEIQMYIDSGDPMDKAGAYAIQHQEFNPVVGLTGCYANVMGLPICHLARILTRFDKGPCREIFVSCEQYLGYSCDIYQQILDN